jgi:hypothetical protein
VCRRAPRGSPTHASASVWIATPSLQRTFTTYSLPLYGRTKTALVMISLPLSSPGSDDWSGNPPWLAVRLSQEPQVRCLTPPWVPVQRPSARAFGSL